jgi:glutamate carboxypeptidase
MTTISLDPIDRSIVTWLDDRFEQQIEMLEELVNTNSSTLNFDGVRRCAALMEKPLHDLGFSVQWIDQRGVCGRAGHLVAEHPGTVGPKLLLMGHLDTVHPEKGAFQHLKRYPQRLVGPGVEDMKNGDVVLIQSLRALDAAGLLEQADVRVIFTGDEEMPGEPISVARAPLVAAASDRDVVLSFEPGEPGVVVTSRRGVSQWSLEVTGPGGHSGLLRQDGVGYGAIYEMARVLEGFRSLMDDYDRMTINPSPVLGGSSVELDSASGAGGAAGKVNVVASSVLVHGDLRCLTPEQLEAVKSRMTTIAEASLPGTRTALKFRDLMPPMAMTPGNERLRRLYEEVSLAVGGGAVAANNPVYRGGGDISFVAAFVPAALDGLGGWGGDAHAGTEWLDLETFRRATRRAALLMARLIREPH